MPKMIPLLTLTRRLHKAHHILLLPQIINPLSTHQSIPPSSLFAPHFSHYFNAAFHQTLAKPSHTIPHIHNKNLLQVVNFINFDELINQTHKNALMGVDKFVEKIQEMKSLASESEAMAFLDDSGVKPSKDLIFSAIWALREEWKLAFLVFKWGVKCGCNVEKTWHLMVWLLGNHQKFGTAWSVIGDLYRAEMDTHQAMLILIDRYAAANCADKAIQTFQIMEKFRPSPDQTTFFAFLNILCAHGNIEEAEEFMFLSKKLFPLETEGFNIILNGWCNISIDVYEAKRVWREMSKCCVVPNGTSYTHMISCFSKVGNLFDSLRLYDEMKKRGWIPGSEVYNSLIYVLTRENCLNEALKTVDRMKATGLQPDSSTYNSMIHPLCEAMKLEEAKTVLAMMIEDNVDPTIDTYHTFLTDASLEGTLEVLSHMKRAGLDPSCDTFLLILRKFFKLEQPENALKIWAAMNQYQVLPLSAHYNTMVDGLSKYGLLVEARRFHAEMKSKGMIVDPKLNKLIREPVQENDHQRGEKQMRTIKKGKQVHHGKSSQRRSKKRIKESGKKGTTGT